jgi:hypothetical protein
MVGDRRARFSRVVFAKALVTGHIGVKVRRQAMLVRQLDLDIAASAVERQRAGSAAMLIPVWTKVHTGGSGERLLAIAPNRWHSACSRLIAMRRR